MTLEPKDEAQEQEALTPEIIAQSVVEQPEPEYAAEPPARVYSPEEMEVKKRFDGILQSASSNLGVDSNLDELINAANSRDAIESRNAVGLIAQDFRFSAADRAKMARIAFDWNKSLDDAAPITDSAAAVIRNGVEKQLDEDGSLEDDDPRLQNLRNGAGVLHTEVESRAEDTATTAASLRGRAKQDPKAYIYELHNKLQDDAKFFSVDTVASIFGFGAPQVIKGNILRELREPVIDKIIDKYGRVGAAVEAGRFDYAIMDAVGKMPVNKQIAIAKRLSEVIKDRSLGSVSAHVYADVANVLFQRVVNPESGKASWDDVANAEGWKAKLGTAFNTEAAENIGKEFVRPAFAVLDYWAGAALITGMVKHSAKRIMPLLSDTAQLSGIYRPKAMKEVVLPAIKDEQVAKAVGFNSSKEAASVIMPAPEQVRAGAGIAINVHKEALINQEYMKRTFDEVASISHSQMSVADPAVIKEQVLSRLAASTIHPHVSLGDVRFEDDLIQYTGLFGKSEDAGYASAEEAIKTVRQHLRSEAVEVAIRKKSNGQLVQPDDVNIQAFLDDAKVNPNDYEYFAKVKATRPAWDFESEVIGQPLNAVSKALSGDNIFANHITRGLSQVWDNAVYSRGVSKSGEARAVVDKLRSMINLNGVTSTEQSRISAVLAKQQAEATDKLLSSAQLAEAGIKSKAGQVAYYNTRAAMKYTHDLVDGEAVRDLTRKGYKDIIDDAGNRVAIAKPAQAASLKAGESYSVKVVENGKVDVQTFNGSDLLAMEKAGWTLHSNELAEFAKRTADNVDVEVSHVLLADNSSKNVRNIMSVIPYAAGYIPELSTGRVAIYGITQSGKKHAIAFADNISDAKAHAASLAAKAAKDPTGALANKFPNGFGDELFGGYKNEYSAMESAAGNSATYENMRGVVYGQKGESITNISKNGTATYLDPLEAIQSVFHMLGTQFTKGRYLEYLEELATSYATKHGLARVEGNRISTIDQLVPVNQLGSKRAEYDQLVQWIKHMDGLRVNPDIIEVWASKKWRSIAHTLSTKQLGILGKAAEKFALGRGQTTTSIFASIAKFNYFRQIRGNPLKHRLQNMASGMVSAVHPKAFAKGLYQRASFNAAVDLITSKQFVGKEAVNLDKALQPLAKSMGMDVAKLKHLVSAYVDGGVFNAADNNILFRNSLETEAQLTAMRAGTPASSGLGDRLGKAWDMVSKTAAELGDVAGEREAMLTNFLTQANYLSSTKGFNIATQAGKDALIAKTMVISGNMTHEGGLALQKGWLRSMFQFSAYSTKVYWNALVPAKLGGSKLLTPTEKWGMAISQFLAYGADAVVGARSAANTAINGWVNDQEVSEQERLERGQWLESSGVSKLVDNGFIGLFLNGYLQADRATWDAENAEEIPYQDLNFAEFMGVTGGAAILGGTFMNAMKGFQDTAGLIGAIGGKDGYIDPLLGAAQKLGGTALGVNHRLPDKVSNIVKSVAGLIGDYSRDEVPIFHPAFAATSGAAEVLVAGYNPYVSLLMSKRYREEIVNGMPRNVAFEDNLYSRVKLFLGLQTQGEAAAYDLRELLMQAEKRYPPTSQSHAAEIKKAGQEHVKLVIRDLVALRGVGTGNDLDMAILDKSNKRLAREMASMRTEDALEYQQAVVDALQTQLDSKGVEREVVMKAMGLLEQDPATGKEFNYIADAIGKSSTSRREIELSQGLADYLNKWSGHAFGDE